MSFETAYLRGIAWEDLESRQRTCVDAVKAEPAKSFLLVSEPRATFTYGQSAKPEDLLWSKEVCADKAVGVAEVARGGKWTFHGPGQVVLYPVLSLNHWGFGRREVARFLATVRKAAEAFLASHGIAVDPESEDTSYGIYSKGRKLVSFGMNVSRGVSSSGLALYLERQTPFFSGINPCGESSDRISSLRELGVAISWEDASLQMVEYVKKGFQLAKNC